MESHVYLVSKGVLCSQNESKVKETEPLKIPQHPSKASTTKRVA